MPRDGEITKQSMMFLSLTFDHRVIDGAPAAACLHTVKGHLDGVTFEHVAAAFGDKFAVEWIDEREEYGEERSVLLGMTGGQLFYVAYTERGANIRIISARRATRHEHDIYYRQNAE